MNVLAALMTRLMPQGLGQGGGEGASAEAAPAAGADLFAMLLGQAGTPAALPVIPGQPAPGAAPSDLTALLAQVETGANETGGEGEAVAVDPGLSADGDGTDGTAALPADIAALVASAFLVPPGTVPPPVGRSTGSASASSGSNASTAMATVAVGQASAQAVPTVASLPQPEASLPSPVAEDCAAPIVRGAPLPAVPAPAIPAENAFAAQPALDGKSAVRSGKAETRVMAIPSAAAPATPIASAMAPAINPAAAAAAAQDVAAAVQPLPVPGARATAAPAPIPAAQQAWDTSVEAAAVGNVGSSNGSGAVMPSGLPSLPEATSLLSLLTQRGAGRPVPKPAAEASNPASGAEEANPDALDVPADATAVRNVPTPVPASAGSLLQPARAVDVAQPATANVSAQLGQSVVDLSSGSQWIDGLAREIATLSAGDGRGSFRLSPEHLGPMRVDLRPVDDGVAIHLSVEVEEAAAILSRESTHLKAEAQATGLRVADVAVERVRTVHEPARADSGTQTGAQSQGQPHQQSSGWSQAAAGQSGTANGQGGGQSLPRKASSDGAVLNHAEPREQGSEGAEGGTRRARYA